MLKSLEFIVISTLCIHPPSVTAGENLLLGSYGIVKLVDQRADFYHELLLGNVSPTQLNKEIERVKKAAEKQPELTGESGRGMVDVGRHGTVS